MIVDVHNHVIPTETLELFGRDPVYGVTIVDGEWRGVHHVPFPVNESFFDPRARLSELDAAGIGGAVVSPPPPAFYYDVSADAGERLCASTNEGMIAYCAHAPERLRWLANLPLQAPELAADTLRSAARAGCSGAAVGTSIAGRRLDEPEFDVFWASAEELGLPVLVHPAFNEAHSGLEAYYLQNVIGNPLETTVMAERLICAGVLGRHPGLRLVLLHGGGYLPYQLGRLRHARGVRPELAHSPEDPFSCLGQLYFDTITHDAAALRYLVERVGKEQVVLGTDMPYDMAMPTPMATLVEVLGEELARTVAEDNPARLFPARPTGG